MFSKRHEAKKNASLTQRSDPSLRSGLGNEPTLDPEFLIVAYCNGFFPMASSRTGEIHWYSPDPRAIIPLDSFKISRSLRKVVRKKTFDVRFDTVFEEVVRACAKRAETWISDEIVRAYVELHRRGYAHSIECWRAEKLAGGLYGVAIRGAFFGESMFSRERDASKVALVHLVERMKEGGMKLLDTQFITEHLRKLGTIETPRDEYLNLLAKALEAEASFLSSTSQGRTLV
jgi:leucyl/phenylalanyl-tRNA--protein transferase